MRTVRTYANGYTIETEASLFEEGLYHCLHNGEQMIQKDGKPASYSNIVKAEKFIKANGAQEQPKVQTKKSGLWTPPPPAKIAPLEDQLALLPLDAPRFVVVEAPYSNYKEQGYAVYDRQEKRFETHAKGPSQSWNNVWNKREFAEETCELCNEEPPMHYSYRPEFVAILSKHNKDEGYLPVKEVEPPAPEQETTFITDNPYEVGDIILDKHNRQYRTIEKSFYLSERDVADMEDANDIFVDSGWHTKAVLVDGQA